MGAPSLECPVCDADLVFSGDERPGDLIHCTFCGAPFVLQKRLADDGESAWEVEEDF